MSKIFRLFADSPRIVEDPWTVQRLPGPADDNLIRKIVPLAQLVAALDTPAEQEIRAVWIASDDHFEIHIAQLQRLELIAVDFPSFKDGRGYSIATLLRSRYGWTGELRAIGDVLRDQLNYLRRCGFDAFAVRANKDIHDAIHSFSRYSVTYQGAVDDSFPLFRQRLR